jgi:hypothetical protein
MDGREAIMRLERRRLYLEETRDSMRAHHDPAWKLSDRHLIEQLVAETHERERCSPSEARIARRIRDLLLLDESTIPAAR